MIEITKSELNKLLLQKKATLKSKPAPKTKPVPKPVDANVVATKELAAAIKTLAEQKPEAQQDLSPVLDAVVKIQQTQSELIQMLGQNKPAKEWSFAVKRDGKGVITSISARGK